MNIWNFGCFSHGSSTLCLYHTLKRGRGHWSMDDTFLKHAWCCLSSIGLCGSTSPSRSCHPTVHRSSCSFPTQALSVHQLSFLNPRSMRQQNLPLLTVNFHHHLLPCDSFWFFSPKVCRGMGCCFILFLFGGPASACCIGDLYKISV